MRVLHVGHVVLSQFLADAFLLLLGKTTGSSHAVAASVLIHVPEPPEEDDKNLDGEADGAGNSAGKISRRILGLEDLSTGHVTGTVRDQSHRRNDGLLRPSGHVGGDC